ncbi:GDP-L-fucose synthase [Sphingomonadales bacterium 56]|uniref:GDP-L-fucose synthase family protein n=1 Tax=unclassified Sphingobium TaxID=2611147 RepID=UPI0019183D6B|nr:MULTISPECIES: GDP-L-fucose synthase [unclassified Sphingobium]MBY2930523.1 GDP-L-fucose synthase [Sphingomonadales bacterium 56]MBY2960678.1 GDP-L-fucose synthase [Sphingomonadales bacterium 58]CAD7341479.1 GDP-L-colitose synthase [Sphingobium sp. S6]CAD7341736.1 GDP-L-colitose synthase [Sphingobium sp. S8]
MAGKLFITGGSGMVGRHIQVHPMAAEWEILAPTSQELDLRNSTQVADYITERQPDLVVHCAGKVGGIRANIAAPVDFLDQNVMIGRNVVMGARAAGVKRLINLGSTCIYPRNAPNPLNEKMILTSELEPTNEGYALAKIVALRLCEYIRREDPAFLYKTLIPCNLYGEYDKFDPQNSHLLPAIIHKVHQARERDEKSVEIWGDGKARREFMYSGDLADAVFKAAANLETTPDLMNVGVGADHSINDYYAIVARVIGWEGSFIHDLSKPVGMTQKLCDTTRQTAWGWRAETSLESGIAKVYQYYKERIS